MRQPADRDDSFQEERAGLVRVLDTNEDMVTALYVDDGRPNIFGRTLKRALIGTHFFGVNDFRDDRPMFQDEEAFAAWLTGYLALCGTRRAPLTVRAQRMTVRVAPVTWTTTPYWGYEYEVIPRLSKDESRWYPFLNCYSLMMDRRESPATLASRYLIYSGNLYAFNPTYTRQVADLCALDYATQRRITA